MTAKIAACQQHPPAAPTPDLASTPTTPSPVLTVVVVVVAAVEGLDIVPGIRCWSLVYPWSCILNDLHEAICHC